jgi:hypothetical protein
MGESSEVAPHAVVSCGSFRASLTPGQTLSFGRGHGHRLRIGHAPQDLRVPRYAGRLECREDGVLVHNMSDKRLLVVQTFPGPSYDILPLMVAGTRPHPQVKVIVQGSGATYAITIDTRRLGTLPRTTASESAARDEGRTVGFDRIDSMSRRHRLMLCALCLPMMTRSGRNAEVPSYQEMERILHEYGHSYRAKTIRNSLDELRSWLTYEHGVEGLLSESANDSLGASGSFVEKLARWAILSGNVTEHDLEQLEADDGDQPL